MRWINQLGERIRRSMVGRYGTDALGRALSIGGCILLIISVFTRSAGGGAFSSLLSLAAAAGIIWCYIRIFSRNYQKRAAENQRYLNLQNKVTGWFRLRRDCIRQRRDYAFFRCPSCHQMVRVPRGKGKIRITCRRCGFAFEKKT